MHHPEQAQRVTNVLMACSSRWVAAVLSLFSFFTSEGQHCPEPFVNDQLRFSVCLDSGVTAKRVTPELSLFDTGDLKVSVGAKPIPGAYHDPKVLWEAEFLADTRSIDTTGVRRTSSEAILIDGVAGHLGSYQVEESSHGSSFVKGRTTVTAVFVWNGLEYVVHCNCYRSDCSMAVAEVRSLCSAMDLLQPSGTALAPRDQELADALGRKLLGALVSGRPKDMRMLVPTKDVMVEGMRAQMEDQEMRERMPAMMGDHWAEFETEFLTPSVARLQELHQEGLTRNIHWSHAKFSGVHAVIDPNGFPGLLALSGQVEFDCDGQRYAVPFETALELQGAYYLVDLRHSELRLL